MSAKRRAAHARERIIIDALVDLWERREAVIALHAKQWRNQDVFCAECSHIVSDLTVSGGVAWPCPTLMLFGIYSEADWWRRNTPPTVDVHALDFIRNRVTKAAS